MIPDNLIINADDFGLDPRVSSAIALCLDEGLINSFSVYPFRDPFHAELLKSILVRHPEVKVGAHLAVVGPGLPEHRGHFADFLARYLTGRMPASEVRALWKAQIEALAGHLSGFGGMARIAHLDSHQHLHVLPGLWPVARALQRETGIPRLRVPYESLRRGGLHRFPFGLGLQLMAFMRATGKTPGFIGFHTSTRFTLKGNRAALERVRSQPGRQFELMVHPALPADDNLKDKVAAAGQSETFVSPLQEQEVAELRLMGKFFDRSNFT